ncbi:hypothetical protein Tco_0031407 [Tanacetum coccineum]
MSNQSEDIQAAGSNTRPPMLDMTDFESWQQRIRLYCKGKYHGEYILQSIDEGPFKMVKCRDEIASGPDGPYLGPEQDRVFTNLSQPKKDRLKADVRATNILLQGLPRDIYKLINHNTNAKDIWDNVKMLLEGSKLTKDDCESQMYDEFEHFGQHKGENIHDYYIRFTKLINDMRHIKMTMPKIQLNCKFINNMLPEWGRFLMTVKLKRGLKESNHDQLYAYLKQHEVHANENKMLMERLNQHSNDPLALVSNVSPYQYSPSSSVPLQPSYIPLNKVQGNNARGAVVAENGGAQNKAGNANAGQGKPIKYYNCSGIDEGPVQDMDQNEYNIFQVDQCDVFNSDVDESPTAQTMFMANLSSADPVYDEVGPSYDSDTLSEVQNHDNYLDNMNVYPEEHEMQNDVQPNDIVDSDTVYTSTSNIISYEQYVQDYKEQVVQSDVSSVLNDALMMIINDIDEQPAQCVPPTQSNKEVDVSQTAELDRYKELAEVQPALYNGHEIVKAAHDRAIVHDSEDTLEIAETTKKKKNAKMKDPMCMEKKIFWSDDILNEKAKALKEKTKALKEQAKVPKPITAMTVYPPNTPAKVVLKSSQQKVKYK